MRKASIMMIILTMFILQSFVTCGTSHAEGKKATHTILLIHSFKVSAGGEQREVNGIEVTKITYGINYITIYPTVQEIYGEIQRVPYTNIKTIIYGPSSIIRKGGDTQ